MRLPPEARPAPPSLNADLERRSERAHAKSKQTFHTNQDKDWRNEVAAQLNTLLGRVQYEMATCLPPDEHDIEFAEAALSLVERVANFEDIERDNAPA